MKHRQAPGAWGCLVSFILGLLLVPPLQAEETEGSRRELWLQESDRTTEEPAPSPWRSGSTNRSTKWGLLGSGAGLVAGVGLALWVKSEADDRYDVYLNTADPDAAQAALNSAEQYDRATLIGWGLAQVSFVAFVYFLTRENKRPLIPAEGKPLVRIQEDGVQVGFQVAP